MTLCAPFYPQHLLGLRLCFTQVSVAGRLGSWLTSTISNVSHRIRQTKWNRVPVHKKPPLGFQFSFVKKSAIFFHVKLSRPSSQLYPNLCFHSFALVLISPTVFFLFHLQYLISTSPPSSGHWHCTIDVDVLQIEMLPWGQEMEEDSGEVRRKWPQGNGCGVKKMKYKPLGEATKRREERWKVEW